MLFSSTLLLLSTTFAAPIIPIDSSLSLDALLARMSFTSRDPLPERTRSIMQTFSQKKPSTWTDMLYSFDIEYFLSERTLSALLHFYGQAVVMVLAAPGYDNEVIATVGNLYNGLMLTLAHMHKELALSPKIDEVLRPESPSDEVVLLLERIETIRSIEYIDETQARWVLGIKECVALGDEGLAVSKIIFAHGMGEAMFPRRYIEAVLLVRKARARLASSGGDQMDF
jgi:hypothetical protein